MEQIIRYLRETYHPLSVIVYGSYADGSQNQSSDFDALVITQAGKQFHDVSFVGDVQLDVFVYPASDVTEAPDFDAFVQIFDGKVVLDSDGIGQGLQDRVLEHLSRMPGKTDAEIREELEWCLKMYARAGRGDAEGYFRWHWLLVDSLEIACDILHRPYYGPKKSLRWLQKHHPRLFEAYSRALAGMDSQALEDWMNYLKNLTA